LGRACRIASNDRSAKSGAIENYVDYRSRSRLHLKIFVEITTYSRRFRAKPSIADAVAVHPVVKNHRRHRIMETKSATGSRGIMSRNCLRSHRPQFLATRCVAAMRAHRFIEQIGSWRISRRNPVHVWSFKQFCIASDVPSRCTCDRKSIASTNCQRKSLVSRWHDHCVVIRPNPTTSSLNPGKQYTDRRFRTISATKRPKRSMVSDHCQLRNALRRVSCQDWPSQRFGWTKDILGPWACGKRRPTQASPHAVHILRPIGAPGAVVRDH